MTNPNRDGWDWPYILYAGRVWLRYTDKETWALTPRQFAAQMAAHEDVLKRTHGQQPSVGNPPTVGYIDQIPGW